MSKIKLMISKTTNTFKKLNSFTTRICIRGVYYKSIFSSINRKWNKILQVLPCFSRGKWGQRGKCIGLVGENYKLNVLRRGKGVNVMGWLVRPTRLATGLLRIRSQLREAQQRGNPEDRLIKNGYN